MNNVLRGKFDVNVREGLSLVLRKVLVDKAWVARLVLLLLWIAGAAWLALSIYQSEPEDVEIRRQQSVATEQLDELEVWIEERQTESEQRHFIGANQYFE